MGWYSSGNDNPYSEHQLATWLNKYPDLEGMAIVTINGQHVASILPQYKSRELIDLLCASFAECFSSGSNLNYELDRGKLYTQIYIETIFGYVFVSYLTHEYLIVLL
jgi:predicted regulator of Ras-like GTPase activity (Roadblock/LC7/MglB family)